MRKAQIRNGPLARNCTTGNGPGTTTRSENHQAQQAAIREIDTETLRDGDSEAGSTNRDICRDNTRAARTAGTIQDANDSTIQYGNGVEIIRVEHVTHITEVRRHWNPRRKNMSQTNQGTGCTQMIPHRASAGRHVMKTHHESGNQRHRTDHNRHRRSPHRIPYLVTRQPD